MHRQSRVSFFVLVLIACCSLVACGGTENANFIPIVAGEISLPTGDTAVSSGDTAVDDADEFDSHDTHAVVDATQDAGAADTSTAPDTTVGDVPDTSTGPKPCAFDAATGPKPKTCPSGQFCVAAIGACTGWVSGTCKPAIVSCPALQQPVCGCDGKTYANPCEAQKAVVTIKLGSACPKPQLAVCAGNTGKTCKAGEHCDIDGCEKTDAGVCVPAVAQGACPNGGQPECGCDDNTYPNGCFRRQANVSKKHAGACPDDPTTVQCKVGPIKPALCPTGTFCQVFDTNPIACVGDGECVKLPVVCDATNKPVCGCNGKTYTNACLLAQAQQNSKNTGQCSASTCTEGQAGCAANAYCAVPQGQCGIQGICISKPPATACTGVIDPVCGCDNKTYTNPSCAAVQGVVIKSKGACGP
ncbi:MAG: hypothetical protein KC502_17625 [Myxococcales bacterium]|nr:hypothetical protein [Myxococcales bacterium]